MVRWIDALARTRKTLVRSFTKVINSSELPDEESLEELEEQLIAADIAPRLAAEWIENLQRASRGLKVSRKKMIRQMLMSRFADHPRFIWEDKAKPYTILLVGINGSGKTTTAAKLASNAMCEDLTPLLGAADTFRAAGSDQLKLWAERIGCDVVTGATGADSASVAYDALDAAIARRSDVLIVDTAGRMHTQKPLMQELQKIYRALTKRLAGCPHEIWVVLDAALGHNALNQARMFNEVVPLTGAVIAKLDGSAKAGFIFSITEELELPIQMVGLGEGPEDLVPFIPEEFVDALLATDDGETGK